MSTSYETASYVGAMDETVPGDSGSSGKRTNGAAEIRKFKDIVKDSFPSVTGAVTSTHTELNKLDGCTATTAELNLLDGVTSTTNELNILDGVTSTAAELNILDGKTFLDEDDLASDSATAFASQQSIKAYIDSLVDGPAFRANPSATQTINNTPSQVSFGSEPLDTHSDYLSNRFTPSRAGVYLVGSCLVAQASGTSPFLRVSIRKNTTEIAMDDASAVSAYGLRCSATTLIEMNGTTDYLEVYCTWLDGVDNAGVLETESSFWGTYIRS